MSMERHEWIQIGLGLAIIAIALGVTIGGGLKIYDYFVPSPGDEEASVALAAYFDTASGSQGNLRIVGTVQVNGALLEEGRALVTVHEANESLDQSVATEIKDGRFDTGVEPAFREYTEDSSLHVEVEISRPGRNRVATAEMYLRGFPPVSRTTLRGMGVTSAIIAVWFFWAFTGAASPGKNQAAIIFSYCAMMAFLALPFAAFYVLGSNQAVEAATRKVTLKTPVGVLQAVPRRVADDPDVEREWVLHIGGSILELPVTPTTTTATANDQSERDAAPQEPAAPAPVGDAAAPEAPAAPAPPRTVVEGGLVVPLYIFVLSIFGGAINMTRMLPRYQKEAEGLRVPFSLRFAQQVGKQVWGPSRGAVAEGGNGQTQEANDEDEKEEAAKTVGLNADGMQTDAAAADETDVEKTQPVHAELTAKVDAAKTQVAEAEAALAETTAQVEAAKTRAAEAEALQAEAVARVDAARAHAAAAGQAEVEAAQTDVATAEAARADATAQAQATHAEAVQAEVARVEAAARVDAAKQELAAAEAGQAQAAAAGQETAPQKAANDSQKDVAAGVDRKPAKGAPLKETTKTESVVLTAEERAAEWRQGLIMQLMYLISAPFLAIAVFYLFDWLDLRKKPLMVLGALSVGLVSDKIVKSILNVVEPILERTTSTQRIETEVTTDTK
jgi:hypothetical protein